MKKIIVGSMILTAAITVGAVGDKPEGGKTQLTPEQKAERKAMAMRRMYERTGGYIIQPHQDFRVIGIVNVDKAVDAAMLTELGKTIQGGLMLPVVVSDTRPQNAGAVIEVKDCDYPATFITAPENAYAMLNVRMLKKDNPDADKLKRRITQEVWRTVVMALGGGYDTQPRCLMKPFATLAELDECPSTCPCPMNFGAVTAGASRFGIKMERRVSYRTACQEGWAPAPTNDIQKAIWDKAHELPTKPLKIEFNEKRDKGK